MAFPPPIESALASALADDLERMLDRGVPPVAIGQWVAVNQYVILSGLRAVAAARSSAAHETEG